MRPRLLALSLVLWSSQAGLSAQPRTLDIYWVDVEGGAATLMIAPSGESLLVDAGWEVGDRDAQRIFAENVPVLYFVAPRLYYAYSRRTTGVVPSVMRPPALWNADSLGVTRQ